jgi:hypothetical protein
MSVYVVSGPASGNLISVMVGVPETLSGSQSASARIIGHNACAAAPARAYRDALDLDLHERIAMAVNENDAEAKWIDESAPRPRGGGRDPDRHATC